MQKRIAVALITALAVNGCKEVAPLVPTALIAVTATTLPSAVVGTAVPTPTTFELRTASGKPVKNVNVSVVVASGGGSLVGAPLKTLAGPTSIGTWTLGTTAGTQTVTATVAGFPAVVFSITATPGAPATMTKTAGDEQRAPESSAVPAPIRVRIADQYNNGISGLTVTWAVDAGAGSVPGPGTSQTDASGVATAPVWTLGLEGSGEQGLTANATGVTGVRFTAEVQDPAASITIETDAPGSVAAGTAVNPVPTFAVRDAGGNILNGVPVTITVTGGGGSITGAPAVSGVAATAIGTWTLGNTPGPQELTVAVSGVPSAVYNTDAIVGPPSIITTVAGAGQSAAPGGTIPGQIRVRVTDAVANPVVGANVSWSILNGGGSVSGTPTVTDGLGEAVAPTWTIGSCGGPITLRAQSGTAFGLVSATMTPTAYGLEVHWVSAEPGGQIQAAFDAACAKMNTVITGSLSTLAFDNVDANLCVSGLVIDGDISGLRIYATVENIDGPGGILGSAGPCYVRNSNLLSVVGRMRFDLSDMDALVAGGTIGRVILHEMMHVVGVGTLWSLTGTMTGSAPGSTPLFTGPLARTACVNDHGGTTPCATAVPIEDCLGLVQSCGAGTINAHWKESTFQTELMTGFLNAGSNPFSKMTMQSLADLGYTISFATADAYTVPSPGFMSSIPALSIRMPEPTLPIAALDSKGRVVRTFANPLFRAP